MWLPSHFSNNKRIDRGFCYEKAGLSYLDRKKSDDGSLVIVEPSKTDELYEFSDLADQ